MNILTKAWWKSAFQQKAAGFSTNVRYDILNGNIISSPDNKKSYLTHGYNINDLIYSIVQLIAEKVKVPPWGPYTVEDETALKSYLSIMRKKNLSSGDFNKAQDLRTKALEPYDKDPRLNELFKYPNENDTFQDLAANTTIYKLLTGDRMVWAELLDGGANAGKPFSLHTLPSQDISLIVTRNWPMSIVGYKLETWGMLNIPREQVLHDKYFNPNCDTAGSHLMGLSPLKSALALTTRSNSENTAATMAYQNGGPKGIIFVDEPAFQPELRGAEAAAVKRILTSKEYVGPQQNGKVAASGYKMGFVPIGLSPADLQIIESEKWSLRRFCNVFGGVPSQLLNDPDNKVYNNTVEGEKALTTRCAIPQLNSFRDHLNRKFASDWGYKGKNIFIDYDMSVYTELQEDLSKKWGYVKEMPITNKRKLEMMGEDIPEGYDEFMNQIFMPTGYESADTYGESETDRALAESNGEVPED